MNIDSVLFILFWGNLLCLVAARQCLLQYFCNVDYQNPIVGLQTPWKICMKTPTHFSEQKEIPANGKKHVHGSVQKLAQHFEKPAVVRGELILA